MSSRSREGLKVPCPAAEYGFQSGCPQGRRGTGKGTYTRLLQAIVGSENTFATELKYLETNRFELSNLRGKVLMVITDAERYSGPINARLFYIDGSLN